MVLPRDYRVREHYSMERARAFLARRRLAGAA
jgi:hypothetical protein